MRQRAFIHKTSSMQTRHCYTARMCDTTCVGYPKDHDSVEFKAMSSRVVRGHDRSWVSVSGEDIVFGTPTTEDLPH